MSKAQQSSVYLDQGAKPVVEKTVVIQPGSGKAVGLGIYQSSMPGPEFEVTFTPDIHDDIGISHEKLDIPGQSRYMLLYQFHNFSQKSCRVTMHMRHPVTANGK